MTRAFHVKNILPVNHFNLSMNWLSWGSMCAPKEVEGLGFRCLHDFNVAQLGKQAWRLLLHPQSLVAQVLKARYYPHCSFLEAQVGHNPSFTWRSILASQPLIRQTIHIWNTAWLPDDHCPYVTSQHVLDTSLEHVADLFQEDGSGWDLRKLGEFNVRDRGVDSTNPT